MASTRAGFVALLVVGIAGCPGGGNPAPTIVSFTCTSPLPYGGGPVTLAWNVNGAVSLSIDNNVGAVNPPTSGSTSVNVTGSTTFTLTATGSTGSGDKATKQCLVVVNTLDINSFTAMPSTLPVGGGTVTLAWNVKDATSLSIDQGVGAVTPVDVGSKTVPVTKTTVFTLTATNAIGKATMTASVVVPQTAPVINSFTATPNSLGVGGGAVTLAWDVVGATALLIDQGVGPVTPADAGEKTVLVGVSTVFTLTASNGNGFSQADAGVKVALPMADGGQAVAGVVVDNNGQPIAGQTVVISSDAGIQTTVTDGDGGFSVANVLIPYSATIVATSQAVQYQGLTRADPSLTAFVVPPDNRSATLSGQFIGGTYPEATGFDTVFFFSSPQATRSLGDQPSGAYSVKVNWPGPSSTTGTLYALQMHSISSLPVDYPGYGTLGGVALQDTGTLNGQNVSLSPVTTGTLSGTIVNVPNGYTLLYKQVELAVAAGIDLSLFYDFTSAATFSYVTPNISNTQLNVTAAATTSLGEFSAVVESGLSANSTVALTIPTSPTLTSPPDAATGVTASTTFSWTPYSGGIYEFIASPQSGQTGPKFYIVTASTTIDLASLGLALPTATAYSWHIVGLGPVASVDVLAQPGGINKLTIDLSYSLSRTLSFTTGP